MARPLETHWPRLKPPKTLGDGGAAVKAKAKAFGDPQHLPIRGGVGHPVELGEERLGLFQEQTLFG